jgi:hypothetical protein
MRGFAGGEYVLVHTGEFAALARLPAAANSIGAPQ